MTDNLEILLSEAFRRSVEENLERDPLHVALDRRVSHAALVASQVKYLRRAAQKLPSWYAARCVVPPLAFEQSSSEAAAARRARWSGGLAVDLTCGLGVDSFLLSRRFERVIALECDPVLAAIARENFRRLGVDNIEVVNTTAEEFLAGCTLRAELVYADPDRRSGGNAHGELFSHNRGKKMVRLEDCSPDIVALRPLVERIAPRLVVKLSPLFDVDEVFRILGGNAHGDIIFGSRPSVKAEVVSLGGECKEIVAEVADDIAVPSVRAVAVGLGEAEYPFASASNLSEPHSFAPELSRWLIVPDVALQKARLARRYFTERGIGIWSDNGYGFSRAAEKPAGIMGRAIEIETVEPFDPKELKRRLRTHGIRGVDILKRDFPLSAADIARQLGVREGGAHRIAFTRAAGRLWQITLKS